MTAVDMKSTRNRIAKRSRRMRRAASRKLQRMAVQQENDRKKWETAKLARRRSVAAWNLRESQPSKEDSPTSHSNRIRFATDMQVTQIPVAPENSLPKPVSAPMGIALKPKPPPPDTALSLRAARLYARYCANASIPDPADSDDVQIDSSVPTPYLSFTAHLLASLPSDPNDDDDEQLDPDFALDSDHQDHVASPSPLSVRTRSRSPHPKRIVPTKVPTAPTSSKQIAEKRPRSRIDAPHATDPSTPTNSVPNANLSPIEESASEEDDGFICEDSSEINAASPPQSSRVAPQGTPVASHPCRNVTSVPSTRPRKLRKLSMSSSNLTEFVLGQPVAAPENLSQSAPSSESPTDSSSSVGVSQESPAELVASDTETSKDGASSTPVVTDSKSDHAGAEKLDSSSRPTGPSGQLEDQGKESITSPRCHTKDKSPSKKNGHCDAVAPTKVRKNEKLDKPKPGETKNNGHKARGGKDTNGIPNTPPVASLTPSKGINETTSGVNDEGNKKNAKASKHSTKSEGPTDTGDNDDDDMDLDDIFADVSSRKAKKAKALENKQVAKNGVNKKSKDGSPEVKVARKGGRRYTEEGYRIMTMEEIAADQPKGLKGECPFDCSCCF